MARTGEKLITETELESRLRKLESKINGILSFLVFIGGVEIKNFLIQGKLEQIAGAGTAVTFAQPYKTATVPLVVGISIAAGFLFCLNAAPIATGFTGYSYRHDGAAVDSWCIWVAIGERG
jgi:hypothetical protein